jgi:hypothetical protein
MYISYVCSTCTVHDVIVTNCDVGWLNFTPRQSVTCLSKIVKVFEIKSFEKVLKNVWTKGKNFSLNLSTKLNSSRKILFNYTTKYSPLEA